MFPLPRFNREKWFSRLRLRRALLGLSMCSFNGQTVCPGSKQKILATDPGGAMFFETGGPPQGGAPVGLAGYGFGWNLGSPQILYGSGSATINTLNAISNYIEPYPYQQLELALMTSPQGSPGKADLTINSPIGTTTLPGAFHFM